MTQVNVDQAQLQLSSLLARAREGEEIVIADHGEPMARLVPVHSPRGVRKPGSAKGKIRIHDSYFDPLPDDIQRIFEGGSGE